MVGLASALVINIGTLSEHWVEAMLLAGRAASARGIPVVLDPVGAGATAYRTETARRILDEVAVTVLRGNAGEVATLVGAEAEVRGVESITAGLEPAELAREGARQLGLVASVTGPVDHVSDGERTLAVANGHPLLAAVTGTGCISSALTGCFLAAKPRGAARGGRRGAGCSRSRRRGRGCRRRRPRHLPCATLRRARGARSRDARRSGSYHRAVTTLADVGEFGLLAELERLGLAQGIEHDAAVVGGLVATQDALVEGVHFRFDLLELA